MHSYCREQVACRVDDPKYMKATRDFFNLGRIHNAPMASLRSRIGGANPFASRVIAASSWLSNNADLQWARMHEMCGKYADRKRKADMWKWDESMPMMGSNTSRMSGSKKSKTSCIAHSRPVGL